MRRIAMVTTRGHGGVRIATEKLQSGLILSGYEVDLVLTGPDAYWENVLPTLRADLRLFGKLEDYGMVIYMNSTPLPDYLVLKNPVKALFVHGLVNEELVNDVASRDLPSKVRSATLLAYRKILTRLLVEPDFCIYHCPSAQERDYLNCLGVMLPQFVLPGEQRAYEAMKMTNHVETNDTFRIVTYLPSVESPRLLRLAHIGLIGEKLQKLVRKKLEITVVSPSFSGKSPDNLKVLSFMDRSSFHRLLSSADLYLERDVDEELSYTSIEAGLLGVPIAKLTLPKFTERCDYTPEEVISSFSINQLCTRLSLYVNNLDQEREKTITAYRRFLQTKRSWETVSLGLRRQIDLCLAQTT